MTNSRIVAVFVLAAMGAGVALAYFFGEGTWLGQLLDLSALWGAVCLGGAVLTLLHDRGGVGSRPMAHMGAGMTANGLLLLTPSWWLKAMCVAVMAAAIVMILRTGRDPSA